MTVQGREQNWDNRMVRFTSKIEKREDWRQRHTGVSLPDFVWGGRRLNTGYMFDAE